MEKMGGSFLIFLDDDIIFSSSNVLSEIVKALKEENKVGVVGTGVLLPKNASWFEKRLAREINRTELYPPLKTAQTNEGITGVCFGVRREVFFENNGLNEKLISGEDPEFFYRLTKKGLRNIIISKNFVYHHAPKSLSNLLRKFYWYGQGHYQSRHMHPEWGIGPKIDSSFKAVFYILIRTLLLPVHFFIDSSFQSKKIKFTFRPFRAFSSYAAAWGYTRAFFKKRLTKM